MSTNIAFPSSPSINDTYVYGSGTYKYIGDDRWVVSGAEMNDAVTFEALQANGDVGTDSNQVAVGNHAHAGTYEPVIATKNDAFNKSFGTGFGTVAQGNDSRFTNTRIPNDLSVSWVKLGTGLKSKLAVSASNIDWSTGIHFTKTLAAALTLTFSNLQEGKTISFSVNGDFAITLPSYVNIISGEYDGIVSNLIQFYCEEDTSTSEVVWCVINQKAT